MSKLTVVAAFARARWMRDFRSRERLEAYQRRRLARHLRFLRRRSAYFGRVLPPTGPLALESLPCMDKATMMSRFDEMNTVGVRRDEALDLAEASERSRDFSPTWKGVSVGLSSGTSGHRGLFIVSDREREAWAGTVLARYLPRRDLLGHRVAFFLRADNNLYETIGSRVVSFSFFDIYEPPEKNVERLEAYQPSILVAPPSVLLTLAGAVAGGALHLRLVRLISVAEVLEPSDEAFLKQAFGQDVIHQAYQCTEGFLAHTCRLGTLHLNEDLAIFEREELGEGRFIPIVTDFTRRSQPIIRYRHNDVLQAAASPCACGSVLAPLARIEGREDDVLTFAAADGRAVTVYSDMIVRSMMYARGFREFRLVQTSEDHLDVYLDELGPEAVATVTAEIGVLAERVGFRAPALAFHPYVRDATKKLRRVERTFGGRGRSAPEARG